MYAIVAPGISGVYANYADITRIRTLYPYAKFRKVKDADEGWAFIRKNNNPHDFTQLTHYGDTFDNMVVKMKYFIDSNNIYYNFNTKGVGNIKLVSDKYLIDNRNNLILVQIPNMHLNPNMISAHMAAIWHGLNIVGDYLDVDIEIPNHSIYYALMSYTGKSRVVTRTTDKIKSRLGNISVTLRIEEDVNGDN